MSVRLSHTWVITVRLTHSYMYAGYRLGGAHSHVYTALNGNVLLLGTA